MNSKIVPILLIVVGVIGLGLSLGDIGGDVGTPLALSGIIGILAGIGFLTIPPK